MAFDYKNLTLVSDTGGFKIYHYTTTDTAAVVDTEGYFNSAYRQLPKGTVIHIHADTDGNPAYGLMVVLSNTDGVVDVGDMVAIGGTGAGSGGTVTIPFIIPQTELLAGTAINLVSPVKGAVSGLSTIVQAAVTTGGDITAKVGTTAVDGLSITVADAATEGTVQSDTPTAGHASTAVDVGDRIQIVPSAAFATAGAVNGYVEITPSGDTD